MTEDTDLCKSIVYQRGRLQILDQLKLPELRELVEIRSIEDAFHAIRTMQVRGAPAIAIVGMLSVAVKLFHSSEKVKQSLHNNLLKDLDYLLGSRPTAVNLQNAVNQFKILSEKLLRDESVDFEGMKMGIIGKSETLFREDIETNKSIGRFGAEAVLACSAAEKVSVLTVCNTGSLATAGYGTALGAIRSLFAMNKLEHVYFAETRPYNQGERLTAYELLTERIPCTMICDSMIAFLMKKRKIHAVIVGADRVASNGDTANKIGTYQAALVAKFHEVPFFVCCPSTTIDATLASGDDIPIEERPGREVTTRIDVNCWNPSFDITPNHLITSIVNETGAFAPGSSGWRSLIEKTKTQL